MIILWFNDNDDSVFDSDDIDYIWYESLLDDYYDLRYWNSGLESWFRNLIETIDFYDNDDDLMMMMTSIFDDFDLFSYENDDLIWID